MFRAVAHAAITVIAPPGPVAWSPGMPPLSESLRTRIRAGAGSAAGRAVSVLPASGRRVVGVAVETGRRVAVGTGRVAVETGRRVAIETGRFETGRVAEAPAGSWMRAPWGDVGPMPGVTVRTSPVPVDWLRPPVATLPRDGNAVAPAPVPTSPPVQTPVRHPTGQRTPVPVPTSTRIRRAAMMAFGLLVSFVAVEAAARVGRR